MAQIISHGVYVPRPRAPLGEIQRFFGRPGRPRAAALATPALDEDALTMAYEAACAADVTGITHLIVATGSAPFGLKKVAATLTRAVDAEDAIAIDLGSSPVGLADGLHLAEAICTADPSARVAVVVSDHVVAYEERVCDLLSAGGAAAFVVAHQGGYATLGPAARHSSEVYDTWYLGREGEPRYRLEVLQLAYATATAGALGGLAQITGAATDTHTTVAPSQPHPAPLKGLGKAGVSAAQLAATSFVGQIGNLGGASAGIALAAGLDGAAPGATIVSLAYGAGEAVAQLITLTASAPDAATAAQIGDGEPIDVSTYYRWTAARQPVPH